MKHQKMREALIKNSDALRQALTGGSVKTHEAADALKLAHEALSDESETESLTEQEWAGLINGQLMLGDMITGESLPKYLARRFVIK